MLSMPWERVSVGLWLWRGRENKFKMHPALRNVEFHEYKDGDPDSAPSLVLWTQQGFSVGLLNGWMSRGC